MIKPSTIKTNLPIPALTIVRFKQAHVAAPLDPSGMTENPLADGITVSAAHDGVIEVADIYDGKYEIAGANFTVGHLYAGAGGALVQDFNAAAATGWIVCVGWALSQTEFIYEPHAPTRFPFTL